jgi:hypothetical protein
LSVAIPAVALAVSCNATVLAAIAAGRVKTGTSRFMLATAELAAMIFAVGASFYVAIGLTGTQSSGGLVGFWLVTMVVSIPLAILLTYVEYIAFGLSSRFRTDLGASLWVGRYGGLRRFGGGGRRPR